MRTSSLTAEFKSQQWIQRIRLNAGEAAAFAKGDIHAIAYGDDTFFIRVTGGDVEKQKTLRFNLEKQTVEVEDRAQRPR